MRQTIPLSLLPLCLAVSGCTFSSESSGFSVEIGANAWNLRHHAAEDRLIELDLKEGDVLILEGIQGDVVVRSADRQPELLCRLSADGREMEEAEKALADVEIEVVRKGHEVYVEIKTEAQKIELEDGVTVHLSPQSDLEAIVPHGIEIRVQSASGNVDVTGPLGPVSAVTSYGDVTVARVTGSAVARSGSGDVELRHIEDGDVTATTNFGDVTLEFIRADAVEAESSSGDLELRDVQAKSIEARSSFGAIELGAIQGDVLAETSSGDIELDGALEGTHRLHSDFGRVEIDRAKGTIRASSDSGDVDVDDSAGDVEATSGFGRVRVDGILSRVIAKSDSGDVDVTAHSGSRMSDDWLVASRFGSLEIAIPEGISCVIAARTDFGQIETSFGLEDDREREGSEDAVQGVLGKGGHKIEIYTSSGDVEIKRSE